MKKLIVIAFVAITATFANAASCSWSFTGVAADPDGTAWTGYKAFLCDATVVSVSVLTEKLLAGDTSVLNTDGFIQNSANTVQQGTASYAKIDSNKLFGDYAAGTAKTFYTLILNGDIADASYFMTSYEKSASVPGTGNLNMSFANISANSGSSAWQTMSVPEPTSGLVMLLGMGVLALRRKKA